jgi:hypothetical protein
MAAVFACAPSPPPITGGSVEWVQKRRLADEPFTLDLPL